MNKDLDVFSSLDLQQVEMVLERMLSERDLDESLIPGTGNLIVFRNGSRALEKKILSDEDGGVLEEIEFGGETFSIYSAGP